MILELSQNINVWDGLWLIRTANFVVAAFTFNYFDDAKEHTYRTLPRINLMTRTKSAKTQLSIYRYNLNYRYNEPRVEMENSSLYREFFMLKNLKTVFFSQILNSGLDLFLKLKKREDGEEKLRFE